MITTAYLESLSKGLSTSVQQYMDQEKPVPPGLLARWVLLQDLIKVSKTKESI